MDPAEARREAFADVDALLKKLRLDEKISLLSGTDFWHSAAVERLHIPAVRFSDGPNGVRGTAFFQGTPASCYPCATGLAASFDDDYVFEIGERLADEAIAKNAACLLGPTVNTARDPRGGRAFESWSEDPLLSGKLAAAYIRGAQGKNIGCSIKHFCCNDQELKRHSNTSELTERALREIYLRPFEIACRESQPWSIMTAYNRITVTDRLGEQNDLHCAESPFLLQTVLRDEWGWDGLVVSDWCGVYSTVGALEAGLDLEMPGPTVWRGQTLIRALSAGKITETTIDLRVRAILQFIKRTLTSGLPHGVDALERALLSDDIRASLRDAASQAVVLLKNDRRLLPLSASLLKNKTLAVIGPNAAIACVSGGGSASMKTSFAVSPLEAFERWGKEHNVTVSYAKGCDSHRLLPLVELVNAEGVRGGGRMDFFNEQVGGPIVASVNPDSTYIFLLDNVPQAVNDLCWADVYGDFVPDDSGSWLFSVACAGQVDLFLDGEMIIENSKTQEAGDLFFGVGSNEKRSSPQKLVGGQRYHLKMRFCSRGPGADSALGTPPLWGHGGMRLGAARMRDEEEMLKEAENIARAADVAVVVAGLNHEWEAEGGDRESMALPGATDRLVRRVIEANANTVVVIQAGTPEEMPWAGDCHTLLHAFYGGNAVGHGICDVLTGAVNPSSKLPLSFYRKQDDCPAASSFSLPRHTPYTEDLRMGYREPKLDALFCFGHGLSYTSFKYDELAITTDGEGADFAASVRLRVTNVGDVAGREVVQLYSSPPSSFDVEAERRPLKELRAFGKTGVLQPGQAETLSLTLRKDAISYWMNGTWQAVQGEWTVLLGASLTDIRLQGALAVKETFSWTGL